MGKSLENGNGTLKLLLTIFIIISVVLGGFVIYDKVLKKNNDKCSKSESSCEKSEENVSNKNNNSEIKLASKYRNIKDKESYIMFDTSNGTWKFNRNECHEYGTMTGTYTIEDNKVNLNMSNDGKAILMLLHDNYDETLLQTDKILYGDEFSDVTFAGCSTSAYFMSE